MATKEVNFRLYCPKCKHYPLSAIDDPCNFCLAQGHNEDSHKPIYYKEKETNYVGRKNKN